MSLVCRRGRQAGGHGVWGASGGWHGGRYGAPACKAWRQPAAPAAEAFAVGHPRTHLGPRLLAPAADLVPSAGGSVGHGVCTGGRGDGLFTRGPPAAAAAAAAAADTAAVLCRRACATGIGLQVPRRHVAQEEPACSALVRLDLPPARPPRCSWRRGRPLTCGAGHSVCHCSQCVAETIQQPGICSLAREQRHQGGHKEAATHHHGVTEVVEERARGGPECGGGGRHAGGMRSGGGLRRTFGSQPAALAAAVQVAACMLMFSFS